MQVCVMQTLQSSRNGHFGEIAALCALPRATARAAARGHCALPLGGRGDRFRGPECLQRLGGPLS
eukprot:2211940-Alexandrium_andersonii.AAC.1